MMMLALLIIVNLFIRASLGSFRSFPPVKLGAALPVLHGSWNAVNLPVFERGGFLGVSSSLASISLRREDSLLSFSNIKLKYPCIRLGASTVVSQTQIDLLKELGVQYISTTFVSKQLINHALHHDIPILCGVSSFNEARYAVESGASALKFYPCSKVSPLQLKSILHELRAAKVLHNDVSVIIAGGVKSRSKEEYLQAGAQAFSVGVQCNEQSLQRFALDWGSRNVSLEA